MAASRANWLIPMVLVAAANAVMAAPPPEPLSFMIKNAPPTGLVAATQLDANGTVTWSRKLWIVNPTDDTQSTAGLRIAQVLVATAEGETVELGIDKQPAGELLAGEGIAVTLTGTFTVAGTYEGTLVLAQSAQGSAPRKLSLPVKLTVAARPAVVAPAPAPVELPVTSHGGKALALTGGDPRPMPLRLHNTSAEPLELEISGATAARVDKADSPTYQLSRPEDIGGKGQTVTIPPGGLGRLDVMTDQLDEPGLYQLEMVVRDTKQRFKPHVYTTHVYRRQGWWCAAIFIALGVIVAAFIGWWASDGGKRLALRRRVALVVQYVDAFRATARNSELIAAAMVLKLDVADRDRELRWGSDLEATTKRIARAELRLQLLHEAAQATEQLAFIHADQQAAARTTIDAALTVVRIDPGDDAKIAAARDTVVKLALVGVRREQLRTQLAELRAQLKLQRKTAQGRFAAALKDIEASLDKAADLLLRSELDELDALVERATLQLVDAGSAALTEIASRPPYGLDAEDWASTQAAITAALARGGDKDERNANLRAAQDLYFRAATEALAAAAERLASEGDPRAEALRVIAAELRKDPTNTTGIYADRLATVRAAPRRKTTSAPGVPGISDALAGIERAPGAGDAHISTESLAGGLLSWIPLVLSSGGSQRPVPTVGALDRAITTTHWAVQLGALVIAVGSGLQVLWLDALTWGGPSAWLVAFLWGAGVQASTTAFAGLAGVTARLAKAPA